MRRTFVSTVCATCFAAAGLFAQQAPSSATPDRTPQTSTPKQTSPSTSPSASTMTVTGCIERASQTAQASANDVGGNDYVLIKPGSSSSSASASGRTESPSATGTTGTTANQSVMYRLNGEDATVKQHLGHKVEIMGMMGSGASSSSGSSSASGNSAPSFHVTSVKMLSATCSE